MRLPFCIEHISLLLASPQSLLAQALLTAGRLPEITAGGAPLECVVEGFKTRSPKLPQQAATTGSEELAQGTSFSHRVVRQVLVQAKKPVSAGGHVRVPQPPLLRQVGLIGLAELVEI